MRKFSVLLGIVAVSTMLAFNVGAATEEDVLGTWYLTSMGYDGVDLSPVSLGMEMTLELAEDGTYTITTAYTSEEEEDAEAAEPEVTDAAPWSLEGDTITLFDPEDPEDTEAAVEVVYAEETLTMDQDGVTMTFGREPGEAASVDVGDLVEAPTSEDIDGVWEASNGEVAGIIVPMSTIGMEFKLTFSGDKVTVEYVGEDDSETLEVDVAIEGDTISLKLPEDLDEESEVTDLLGEDAEIDSIDFKLYSNGYLVFTYENDEMPVQIYFEKAE